MLIRQLRKEGIHQVSKGGKESPGLSRACKQEKANKTYTFWQMQGGHQQTTECIGESSKKNFDQNPSKHQKFPKPELRVAMFLKQFSCSQSCCQRNHCLPHLPTEESTSIPGSKNDLDSFYISLPASLSLFPAIGGDST